MVYADPAKVHPIDHVGKRYTVVGPHLSEPSPQRTPVLFQAGHSERGRDFTAQHAEGAYILAPTPDFAREQITDVRGRAAALGRDAERMVFFIQLTPVVGGTEEEARRASREIDDGLCVEALLATRSALLRIDLSTIDPHKPLAEVDFTGQPAGLRTSFERAAAEGHTLASAMRRTTGGNRLVGTPEQVADQLEEWHRAGVRGINLGYATTPGTYVDFVEHVVPLLQRRGLMQDEYRDGTLRHKLFGEGDLLPDDHPAARYRR
jgi:long-chain alkane monooxygenase